MASLRSLPVRPPRGDKNVPMKNPHGPVLSEGLVTLLKANAGSSSGMRSAGGWSISSGGSFLGEAISRPPDRTMQGVPLKPTHFEGSHCKECPSDLLKGSKQWFEATPEPTKKWYHDGMVNVSSRERRDPQQMPYNRQAHEASYRYGQEQQLVARAANQGNMKLRDASVEDK